MTHPASPLPGNGGFAALQRAADLLSYAGAWMAAGCILGLTGLVLAEIAVAFLARFVPALPSGIGIGWEYGAYLMGASFLLGAGMTLRAGLMLRVEILLRAGHGRLAAALELVSAAIGSALCLFLAASLAHMTWRTWGFGEVSQDSFTPLWIPQAVLTLGAAILALQMVTRLLACLLGRPLDRPEIGAATAIE
ncbi:MAG TPA: TRAP transporter small permease [Paracoccaceae bacterium]|nr:TRAP transporter small permease [Paracoccaceae bacterium]